MPMRTFKCVARHADEPNTTKAIVMDASAVAETPGSLSGKRLRPIITDGLRCSKLCREARASSFENVSCRFEVLHIGIVAQCQLHVFLPVMTAFDIERCQKTRKIPKWTVAAISRCNNTEAAWASLAELYCEFCRAAMRNWLLLENRRALGDSIGIETPRLLSHRSIKY